MPRLPQLAGAATAVLALGLVAAAPAAGQEPPGDDAHVVAHFDPTLGQTPDNIALDRDGSADLTLAFARQVAHVDADGTTRILATLPDVPDPSTPLVHSAVVTGIARAHDGTLYVGYATGTRKTGIWRLVPGEEPEQITELPPTGFPNGLVLDEQRGVLYATDSVLGTVWRLPRQGGPATAWATGPALDPLPDPARGFGVNGVKIRRDTVWVSNSDRGTLLRIPVRADGSAGPVETRATGLAGIDDFAFLGPGTSVLATADTANSLELVGPDGATTTVLSARDGLSNPTAVAVSGRTVYVANAAYYTQRDPNLLLAHLRSTPREAG
ncbi:hypothetical protein AQI95_03815 [Streptomyces yokosukanensis]|uniref:SMP-30/Gluconolactonase/LRE-like region domain-containing protein n=1 Tax=Streptomyces yokosukanensis TaxID=67386 RepID=A0A124HHC3_9ACTN|nr:hypothetical protein [Streptomyces yokosukanensis]KUN09699.1 hypothetical protein AQI95_03815 [Streptomyces yokosukanensis]